MFKRVFKLFQIARKFSTSGSVEIINEIHQLPVVINLFFNLISLGSNSQIHDKQKTSGEKLCVALQGMGTTFIKLGQFLATRPDIIGEELAKSLEKLQLSFTVANILNFNRQKISTLGFRVPNKTTPLEARNIMG